MELGYKGDYGLSILWLADSNKGVKNPFHAGAGFELNKVGSSHLRSGACFPRYHRPRPRPRPRPRTRTRAPLCSLQSFNGDIDLSCPNDPRHSALALALTLTFGLCLKAYC